VVTLNSPAGAAGIRAPFDTGATLAEERQVIDGGQETVMSFDLVSKGSTFIVKHEDRSTFATDQMAMAARFQDLEFSDSATQIGFRNQTQIPKELECVVDG
jgi:hypothetical protein